MSGDYENTNYENCKKFLKTGKTDTLTDSTDPSVFKKNIQVLKERLSPLLDEFKKNYVVYNNKPEYSEYRQIFVNSKQNLTEIGTKAFAISSDIQNNTNKINKKLVCLNIAINKEKEKNIKLKRALGRVEEKNNASTELISDYEHMYQMGYLRNLALFISIIVVFIITKKMFSNINGEMNPKVKGIASNIGNSAKNAGSNIYNNIRNMSSKYRK